VTNPAFNFHSAYGRKYNRRVYVATDEPSIWNELTKYPQYDMLHGEGATAMRYSKDGLETLLVELFTLCGTGYFVGTFSSQVSRLVYEIYHTRFPMEAHARAWSLDDPWYSNTYEMYFPGERRKGT
jgi:hypothetical protein